jgi:tetratricopeptide (TPR) repeat protein
MYLENPNWWRETGPTNLCELHLKLVRGAFGEVATAPTNVERCAFHYSGLLAFPMTRSAAEKSVIHPGMTIEADKTQRKGPQPEPKRGFKTPESGVVLLAVLSLIVLFNPFSEEVLAIAPALSFLAAFALFMVPGLVLALALLPGPELAGLGRIPLAFVLSTGVFGFAALAPIWARNFTFYPHICGGIIALSLGLAVVRIFFLRKRMPEVGGERPATDVSTRLLWAPFLLFAGMLAWISSANVPGPGEDSWIYLSRVRVLSQFDQLAANLGSRLDINGWLPEQAVLSLVSGLDPVALVLRYLSPTLVVVALLALYALARTLLENEKAALVIGSLAALFFLVGFGASSFDSVLAPSGEFVNRITEDKYVARYVFVPVALSLAILFMRDRSRRNLGLFFFVCLSTAVVHPLGLVFIGISVAGFGLIHLATSWRDRGAWRGVGGLWFALFVIIAPPALYLLATGNPLIPKLDAMNPEVAATLIDTWQHEQRLLEIGEGSYVVHPSLLLDPAMLVVYLLGVPFLIWKVRGSLAAQLLLGVLAFAPVLTFVPYVSTYVSILIGPWNLERLTWPLLLAALLTLGWMFWEASRFVGSALGGYNLTRRAVPFLPLILVGCLSVSAIPLVLTGLRAADASGKAAQDETYCLDPTFHWMQEVLRQEALRQEAWRQEALRQGTLPPQALPPNARVMVMAPLVESSCIMAYSASANVLGTRGAITSEAEQDLKNFYAAPTLGPEALEILERLGVRYVMLPANSPLDVQLDHLPGFTRMDNPGERYRMYEVGQEALEPTKVLKTTPAIVANGYLNDEARGFPRPPGPTSEQRREWDAAIQAYTKALEDSPDDDDRFVAYLGLGRAYVEKGQYAAAVENYEVAIELDPESSAAHDLLANAYNAAGEKERARTEFERAVELDPENVDLRLRYGQFLVPVDRREAVEQHQEVVEMYPKVPGYRVRLGAILLLAGVPEAADEQFERAIYLDPFSADVRADIGGANQLTGRPQEALEYYESALELEPNSQLYALNLGRVHARLSTLNGRDEEHFKEAEALLRSVDELGRLPWEADQREAAQIALGDLYLEWDRPGDAIAAYERALELNPDSEEAQEKLDGLRRER